MELSTGSSPTISPPPASTAKRVQAAKRKSRRKEGIVVHPKRRSALATLILLLKQQDYAPMAISGVLHILAIIVAAFLTLHLSHKKPKNRAFVEVDTKLDMRHDLFESNAWTIEPEPMLRKPGGGPLAPVAMPKDSAPNDGDDARQALAGLAEAAFNPASLMGGAADEGGQPAGLAPGIGAAGGIGEGAADFFGASAKGKRIVYVIDRSFSMYNNDSMEHARQELLESLEKLSPNMEFQVIFYNDEAEMLQLPGRNLVVASLRFRKKARDEIRIIEPTGGTDHGKALRKAVGLRPDVIFMLTDAEDAEPAMIKSITRLNSRRKSSTGAASIHVIQFHHEANRRADDTIKDLALENNGTYRLIDTNRLDEES